jgi:hypothetical protein
VSILLSAALSRLGERRLDIVEFYWVCLACDQNPNTVYNELIKEFAKLD